MDEKEKELSEFSLEDILKEFGSFEDTEDTPELDEDIRLWDEEGSQESKPQPPVQDTVRLDDITKQVKQMEAASQETVRFTPVGEEAEEEVPPVKLQQEEKVEPFSEQWEPEYEQPIADYIPPQPIIFRPKNRLREL